MKLQILLIFSLITKILMLKNERTFKNSRIMIEKEHIKMETAIDEDISFFAIGDWGGLPDFPYRTVIEQNIAATMTKYAYMHNVKFQVALGDNFYFDGVKNDSDKRFKTTFEDVFSSEPLLDTPWFFVLGNHDHYGNASAQISYMQYSKRWIFPNFNYTMSVTETGQNRTSVKFIFIDTVLMCGNTIYGKEKDQPVHTDRISQIQSEDYFQSLEDELRYVTDTEKIDYLFVAGHYPVWSIAEHGSTKCLVERLRPLLHKYNVSGYMSGHDHNLQHISDEFMGSRVEYILSGAGNFIDNSTEHIRSIPKNSLRYHFSDSEGIGNGGLCLFKATKTNLTVTFLESSGLELYQTVIQPRI